MGESSTALSNILKKLERVYPMSYRRGACIVNIANSKRYVRALAHRQNLDNVSRFF